MDIIEWYEKNQNTLDSMLMTLLLISGVSLAIAGILMAVIMVAIAVGMGILFVLLVILAFISAMVTV
jgi:hypothetical protein